MKKNMNKAIMMALVMMLALAPLAQADTIVSPTFRFYGVAEQPTEVPTAEPTVEPTAEPTAEPEVTAAPEASVAPTAAPVSEPEVTAEPTEAPTAEPLPEITVSISSNLAGKRAVRVGTEMVLTMTVENAAGRAYTIQWQQSTDDGATWSDIPGANGEQYSLSLQREHTGMLWRVTIDIEDAAANE